MKKNQDQPADAAQLRRRAEERLKRQRPARGGQRTEVETARLVHELQVHQIELEVQNEELQQGRAKVEALLAQYSDLYDFAPAGYFNLDREGAIRRVNLTGARLLGVERSRLVNRRFGLFVAEGDRRAFSDFLAKVFTNGAKESCEVTLSREEHHPLHVQIEGIVSEDGQECRIVVMDITQRKQAEEEILGLAKFPAENPNPVMRIGRNGTILYANQPSTPILTAWGREVGQNVPDACQKGLAAAFESGISKEMEIECNGRIFSCILAPILAEGYLNIYGRDITRSKQMEEKLIQQTVELREHERGLRDAQHQALVGRLAASVAHEVNNPLFAIKMQLSILNGTTDRPELVEKYNLVSDQLDRIGRATQSLLGFFRQRTAPAKSLSYSDVIRTVADLFESGFTSHGVSLIRDIPHSLPLIAGSADGLQEVLINLLENAREAMGDGQKVSLSATAQDHEIVIRVEDDGPGLGEDPERLFEPYYTTKATGTGLGLTIARQICERQGGKLVAENREEGGARFKIILPLRE